MIFVNSVNSCGTFLFLPSESVSLKLNQDQTVRFLRLEAVIPWNLPLYPEIINTGSPEFIPGVLVGVYIFRSFVFVLKFMCIYVIFRLVRDLEIALSVDFSLCLDLRFSFAFSFLWRMYSGHGFLWYILKRIRKKSTKFILYTNLPILNKYGEYSQNHFMIFQ